MAKRTETDLLRFYGGDIKVRTEKNGFQRRMTGFGEIKMHTVR